MVGVNRFKKNGEQKAQLYLNNNLNLSAKTPTLTTKMASHYENYPGPNSNAAYSQQYPGQQQQPPIIDFYKQSLNTNLALNTRVGGPSSGLQQVNSQGSLQQVVSPHSNNFSGSSSQMANSIHQANGLTAGINVYQNQPRERYSYEGNQQLGSHHVHLPVHHQHQPSRSNANNNAMLITSSEQFDSVSYSNQQQPTPQEPSPITTNSQKAVFSQMARSRTQTSGAAMQLMPSNKASDYVSEQQQFNHQLQMQLANSSNANTLDSRKDSKPHHQIQMVDRNVANKRRSIENREAAGSGNYEQLAQSMNPSRQGTSGVKSAFSNYPMTTTSQPQPQIVSQVLNQQRQQSNSHNQNAQAQVQSGIKQINKMSKVERDPMADSHNANGALNKRSLAKSQSQNRLVLLSQDMLNKNNPYSDQDRDNQIATDKNSFFKDQVVGAKSSGQSQDLLYKQHMQYSGGHQATQKNWLLKTNLNNLVLSRMTTKSECTFCNKTSANGMISLSSLPHHCSSIYCSKDQQGMMIQQTLSKKYSTNLDYYNLKVVNDLIYNENTHIVSIFKDYLILDDINEFLKRSYSYQETKSRLPKLCSFYEKYSQVFPNYVVLPESKYMFKNIQRKQKLIDEQYQLQEELAKKQHQTLLDEEKLFNTRFYNSYYSNMGGDLSMSRRQYEDQAKAIAEQAGRKPATRIDQMKIDELVDRFLMKDSESNIQLLTSMALDFSEFQNSFANQSQSKVMGQASALLSDKNFPSSGGKQTSSKGVVTPQQQQKPTTVAQMKNQQVVNQINQIKNNMISSNQNAVSQGKKSLDSNVAKKGPVAQITVSNANNNSKKQKTSSFNNNQASTAQQTRLSQNSQALQSQQRQQPSEQKISPRLQQKSQPHISHQQNRVITITDQQQLHPRMQAQTSPATKDAIANYLQECNLGSDELMVQGYPQPASYSKQGFGPMLSPGSTNMGSSTNLLLNNPILDSPQIKSPPNYIGPKSQLGVAVHSNPHSGSQTSLHTNQQQNNLQSAQGNSSQQSRSNPKSQCTIASNQTQTITSMKKSTNRLSNGGASLKQQVQAQRKNASPVPSQQKQGQQQTQQAQSQFQPSSRNQQMNSNSTQKSMKSIHIVGSQSSNSGAAHTKYLSGGNDQYQKMLGTISSNNGGNGYETQTVNSSAKKSTLLQASRSKQPGSNSELTHQGSHQKLQAARLVKQPSFNHDNNENDVMTGEDCDDFGIADERFTSPDGNKALFQTIDDNLQGLLSQGRRSLEGLASSVPSLKQGGQGGKQNNIMLFTSSDDKVLANSSNYDQIKRHLEQCISVNGAGPQSITNMGSIPSQQTFDFQNTLHSNSKKYNVHVKSGDKYEEVKQSVTSLQPGYNREAVSGSSISTQQQQNSQDQSASRNGTQKKQFESLKQRIKGHFDTNQYQPQPASDTHSHQSASKTPHKQSALSKKSLNTMGVGSSSQQMLLQQNRMSLESNQMLMMMPSSSTHLNGNPLTSTSANGRQLSFSQTQLSQNQINYRSITNMQQRKTSNNQTFKEASIENSKRLSGQNRQSFKELSQQPSANQPYTQQQMSTALNDNKMIKRSATGKTLNIQDSNIQQSYQQLQNNYLHSVGSASSITNPNFVQNNSQAQSNNKLFAKLTFTTVVNNSQNQVHPSGMSMQAFHQQQMSQQAANQVRVMTPSYSLASLSKVISPTTTTSPMTMTVSLANGANTHAINRKQGSQGKTAGKGSALGASSNTNHHHNPSSISNTLSSSHSQNFLLQDKSSKLATSSIYQNSQKAIISSKSGVKSSIANKNSTMQAQSHPIQISTTINQKLGRVPANHHQMQQQQNSNMSLNQHTLVQTFQTTPRGGNLVHSNSGEHDTQTYGSVQALNPQYSTTQVRRGILGSQPNLYGIILENSSQNISCTVSTENHSTAKAIESNKHPKFMKTIEEFSNSQGSHTAAGGNTATYNTMLSASMGQGRGGILSGGSNTLTNSLSQAQLEVKNQKNKIQTVVNSNQASIKRQTLGPHPSSTLSQSGSISHFKSPSQQINSSKRHLQGRQLNM